MMEFTFNCDRSIFKDVINTLSSNGYTIADGEIIGKWYKSGDAFEIFHGEYFLLCNYEIISLISKQSLTIVGYIECCDIPSAISYDSINELVSKIFGDDARWKKVGHVEVRLMRDK